MAQTDLQQVLDTFTVEELQALKAGNNNAIPLPKLQAVQAALAPAPQAPQGEAPSQRLRSLAQGITFGSSDELEAYLQSLAGVPYDAAVADIRSKLEAYRKDSPYEALAYEAGGAILPAIAATTLTGGAAAPVALPALLARAAGVGALQGGLTGFATGEGDFFERSGRVVPGMVVGGVAGPVGTTLLTGGSAVANKLIDFTRRTIGGRGAKAVETEIQRLATESGLTTDEIVDRVAKGEIMAENATLQSMVRAMYTQGGPASATIGKALTTRPNIMRDEAMKQMRAGLSPTGDKNILRQYKMDEADIKVAENAMYTAAFEKGGVVDKPMLDAFSAALQRAPQAAGNINQLYRATTGKAPFFTFKDGNIEYSRTPNLEDMEIVRRGIQDEANKAFSQGAGGVGTALKDVELQLRNSLDQSSKALAGARQTAAQTRSARDAFQEGRKAFTKSADEVAVEFESMSPAAKQAYRSGLMDAVRTRMATGSRKSVMGQFADEERKEGQILRSVFPQDQLDSLLGAVNVAAGSQRAATGVLGGSNTALNLKQGQRIGMNISPEEVTSALGGNVMSGYRVLRKLVGQNTGNLTDAQSDQIARILVSQNPQVVRNALVDESAMAALQDAIKRLSYKVAVGAPGAVTQIGAGRLQPTQQK